MKRLLQIALVVGCFMGCLGSALARWSVSGDAESFHWRESTTPSVSESGPRFGLGGSWRQEKDAGWLLGWRGKLYWGSVDYNGALLFTGAPATGTTDYAGASNELQVIYRPYGGNLEGIRGAALAYFGKEPRRLTLGEAALLVAWLHIAPATPKH